MYFIELLVFGQYLVSAPPPLPQRKVTSQCWFIPERHYLTHPGVTHTWLNAHTHTHLSQMLCSNHQWLCLLSAFCAELRAGCAMWDTENFAGNNLTRMVGLRAICWQHVRKNCQKRACSNIVRLIVVVTVLLRGLACSTFLVWLLGASVAEDMQCTLMKHLVKLTRHVCKQGQAHLWYWDCIRFYFPSPMSGTSPQSRPSVPIANDF